MWSPKTPEVGSTSFTEESKAFHIPAHDNKDLGSSRMQQGASSIPQSKFFRREATPRWNQSPRYENV